MEVVLTCCEEFKEAITMEFMESVTMYCDEVGENVTLCYRVKDYGDCYKQMTSGNICLRMRECPPCPGSMMEKRRNEVNSHFQENYHI